MTKTFVLTSHWNENDAKSVFIFVKVWYIPALESQTTELNSSYCARFFSLVWEFKSSFLRQFFVCTKSARSTVNVNRQNAGSSRHLCFCAVYLSTIHRTTTGLLLPYLYWEMKYWTGHWMGQSDIGWCEQMYRINTGNPDWVGVVCGGRVLVVARKASGLRSLWVLNIPTLRIDLSAWNQRSTAWPSYFYTELSLPFPRDVFELKFH